MNTLAPYWKALVGFVAPGAVVIGSAVTDTSDGGTAITTAEWVTAVVACLVTSAAVYAVPNKPAHTRSRRIEIGHVDLATVLLVGILVILVLIILGYFR